MPETAARPLAGVHVLVTRPREQADHLAQLIEAAGGEAIRFPVVEIAEPADHSALNHLIERLTEFDVAVFISPNAVNKAMNLIKARGRSLPAHLKLACVGRGSAKALRQHGVDRAIVPPARFDSEALLALPELQQVQGLRIVIFRGDGGRELLGNSLIERGASVEYAECYRRVRPHADITPLLRQWARGAIDIVSVTSVEGLRNLYDMVGKLGQQWLVRTPIVAVSARLAQTCRELGFKTEPLVTHEASDEAILETIKAWRATQNPL